MLEAIREYYFNDDPSSAGNWLLGALAPPIVTSTRVQEASLQPPRR